MLLLPARFSHFPMAFRGAISGRQWIRELRIKMINARALRDLPRETIFHGDSRTPTRGDTRFHAGACPRVRGG